MEEEKVRESGLTLTDIWLIIKRHLLAIIIIVVAFSAVGMVYSKFEKPMYKSTASVLVSYKDESDETPATTELSVSRFLADEYVDMLKDDKIMLTAKKKLCLWALPYRLRLFAEICGLTITTTAFT